MGKWLDNSYSQSICLEKARHIPKCKHNVAVVYDVDGRGEQISKTKDILSSMVMSNWNRSETDWNKMTNSQM